MYKPAIKSACQMLLRMLAAGSATVYFKNRWNLFDLTMVAFGWTVLVPAGSGGKGTGYKCGV